MQGVGADGFYQVEAANQPAAWRASVYSCETKAFSRWVELDAPVRD